MRGLLILICLLLVTPAYAQKTKTQLNTEVTTNLPDNTVGAITPADVRTTMLDMIASWVDLNGTSGFNCAVNQWVNAFSNLSTPSCSQPTFANIAGNIVVSQMASGTGASGTTYWRGDGTWATPAGSGTVTEQKNTAGIGLTTSGNCDNTSSNAGSPCQHQVALTNLSNTLLANVALSVANTFFDGPSVAQGTAGTWFASGVVNLQEPVASSATFVCRLSDGTTVLAAAALTTNFAGQVGAITLSGILASPAGNIRISCTSVNTTTGVIRFSASGTGKDATLAVIRIQ